MAAGAIMQLVAMFMISLCKEYYQFFLGEYVQRTSAGRLLIHVTAQGVLLGAGMSFVAIPASGICPRYFKRNRGVATGISVAGSSLGGVLWPLACDQLLHTDGVSFDWTIRIIGFIMLPLLVVVVVLVRPPLEPKQETEDGQMDASQPQKPKVDRATLRKDITKPPFVLLCTGLFLAYLGFFSPFFYVSTYATHLGMSQRLAFYLVSMVNGASLVGRILPGFL